MKGLQIRFQVAGFADPSYHTLSREWPLFSESNSRFLCEVEPERAEEFEAVLSDVPCAPLGRVTDEPNLVVHGLWDGTLINENIADLKAAWKNPLAW